MSAWLLAATLCLTQLPPAWGQSTPPAPDLDEDDTARTEPQPEQEEEPQGEVVIVLGERQSKEALEAMDKQLRDLGYDTVRRRNGRTIYLHETDWRNKVIVDDDGYMYFRQRPPHFVAPPETGFRYDDWPVFPYLICVVVPTACVSGGTLVVRPSLKEQDKERTVEASEDELRLYADALAAEALTTRLYDEVPSLLDGIWLEGVHAEDPEAVLDTPQQRRAAILDFWLSRSDNPYGDAVREVVEAYMVYVINESEHPYTRAEISAANAARSCARELVLTGPEAPPEGEQEEEEAPQ